MAASDLPIGKPILRRSVQPHPFDLISNPKTISSPWGPAQVQAQVQLGQVLTSTGTTPQWFAPAGLNQQPMSNTLPPNPPANFTVSYEHLTARQCEKLKDDVIEKIEKDKNHYKWKTYGAKRDEKLTEYPISDLSNQHLENILITQPQIDNELAAAILMTLKNRYGVL